MFQTKASGVPQAVVNIHITLSHYIHKQSISQIHTLSPLVLRGGAPQAVAALPPRACGVWGFTLTLAAPAMQWGFDFFYAMGFWA